MKQQPAPIQSADLKALVERLRNTHGNSFSPLIQMYLYQGDFAAAILAAIEELDAKLSAVISHVTTPGK